MAATSAQKPIAGALSGHDPKTIALCAVGATDRIAIASSCPLDQTATFSAEFWRRVVRSIASRRYFIATDTRILVS